MKLTPQKITLVSLLVLVQACGSNQPKTLASLAYEPEKESAQPLPEVDVKPLTHQEVRKEYKALLDLFEENKLKEKIERRIADVHMMESVHNQNTDNAKSENYSQATQAYQDILKKYPNSPDNAEVLYQLSKAYDIEGKQEDALAALTELTSRYPNYVNIAEAYFRKGDIHFSNQEYTQAEQSYAWIVKAKNQKLDLNANYMLGWSRYKLFEYRQSIDSFTYVLNRLLANNADVEALAKKDKPLVNDSISSISLAIDKLGGAKEIAAIQSLAKQDYVWRVYDNLGGYYLTKELYEESASTYRLYVDNFKYSDQSPGLRVKIIETYLAGGFNGLALKEKENYVGAYGIASDYFSYKKGATTEVKQKLNVYLDELASHFHSKGQLYQKEIATLKETREQQGQSSEIAKKLSSLHNASFESFDQAADFYTQYINTFPTDQRVDEMTFLKAEALFSSYQYPRAIVEYEKVAYAPKGTSAQESATNAGYAAIISYEKHIARLKTGIAYEGQVPQQAFAEDSPEVKAEKQNAVGSMLKFANTFHTDQRSPSVLTNAAEYLFSINQYQNAINVSTDLIAKNATLDKTLKKTAYGIIALSYFNLEDYQKAEDNYINQRALVDVNDEEYTKISELLAASIYKKSERMIANGEEATAITQLLKIKQLAPASSVRVTAQYDATSLLLKAERWDESIVELLELQQAYPEYEYAVEFPRKLAFAYEKKGAWIEAAEAYVFLLNNDPDDSIRQEALFLSATMYDNAKDYGLSNEYFEQYVQTYQQPFDNYMEAHYKLASNYEKLDQQSQYRKWLDRIVSVHQEAGSQQTERSRWLAAWANAKYGDYQKTLFSNAALSLPLVESIKGKNILLQEASSRYEAAADSGLLEFVAMSSYKIGVLYREFAQDLRESPTPSGLSEADQQTYAAIIEEQAAPFDELARDLHQGNIDRAWNGKFNQWVGNSFVEMRTLAPKRYSKVERIVSYGEGIY